MIAYKIIGIKHRRGYLHTIWTKAPDQVNRSWSLSFANKRPSLFPVYEKGKLIKADPSTVGILCFEKLSNAIRFLHSHYGSLWENTYEIVRVIGYHPAVEPMLVAFFYNTIDDPEYTVHSPKGTIAFDEIYVLE